MTQRKKTIIFSVVRDTEHGYTTDRLFIGEYLKTSVEESLAGTVDNKAGYGTPEAAAQMGRMYAAMLADGHKHYFDWSLDGHRFSIKYQVYEKGDTERPDYCDPHIGFPEKLEAAQWAMKVLQRIGKRTEAERVARRKAESGYDSYQADVSQRSLEQLQDVVAALRSMGAVETNRWHDPSHHTMSYEVPKV
jgi:putative lipoic acid-binding regulatory protein